MVLRRYFIVFYFRPERGDLQEQPTGESNEGNVASVMSRASHIT